MTENLNTEMYELLDALRAEVRANDFNADANHGSDYMKGISEGLRKACSMVGERIVIGLMAEPKCTGSPAVLDIEQLDLCDDTNCPRHGRGG